MAKRQTTQAEETEVGFEDSLRLTARDVREPSLIPTGPWVIRNVGFSTSDVTDKEGNAQIKINFRYAAFEPGPEVDPEDVEKGGFEGKTLWIARYISKPAVKAQRDGSLARYLKFVTLHGVDTEDRDVEEMAKAMKGASIQGVVGTRTYTNKEQESVTDNTVTELASVQE